MGAEQLVLSTNQPTGKAVVTDVAVLFTAGHGYEVQSDGNLLSNQADTVGRTDKSGLDGWKAGTLVQWIQRHLYQLYQ